jgi:hypothetical protein
MDCFLLGIHDSLDAILDGNHADNDLVVNSRYDWKMTKVPSQHEAHAVVNALIVKDSDRIGGEYLLDRHVFGGAVEKGNLEDDIAL